MNNWIREAHEKIKLFFQDYGKVFIVGMCLSVSLMSSILLVSIASPHKLRVSFLDVGQGDAILIQTPGGYDMLIDGGPSNIVLTRLAEKMTYFNRDIDMVIATHGDADHITGLIPVMEKYEVRNIVHSSVRAKTTTFSDFETHIEKEGADVHIGKKGDEIDFGDGVIVNILYPTSVIPSSSDTNDASVSVVIKYGEHSFLLSGDLTSKYESQLIGGELPKYMTVYKAGHHGSKTSSGEQLLTYIRPEYAVVSAGKENKYGHPNPETIVRLEKYAKEILSTIDHGMITFESDGRLLEVETSRR